ncbi:hypothetical protein RvY_16429 [Ramazzottius varieornatus]|uniref:Receptor ligand binding region domain-containing protein n=1 Tax=Ramazzottius varieornatus TaxID=947166 RepID=A0A1D1VYG4_RAMVA|nr:hypothetical protein RvY_16429 [Ramazzottius varieornatus]
MTFRTQGAVSCLESFQSEPIHVEIISVGNIHPTSISSLPYTAPAMTVALEELRHSFGDSVMFKHTLLYDVRCRSCNDLTDNVDRLVAEYYYSRQEQPNVTAFIAPGCTERINFAKLVRGWNHLLMIGGNGELIFRNKQLFPNVILAGKNAVKSYTDLFRRLFRQFKWRNIYIILDTSAKPFHLLLAPNLLSALATDRRFDVKYAKTSEISSESDFDSSLRDIQATSRGRQIQPPRPRSLGAAERYAGSELTAGFLEARDAFRSAFVITASPELPANVTLIQSLNARFKELSKHDYNLTYGPNEEILQEILSGNYSDDSLWQFLRNGSAMAELFSNRSFQLPTTTIEFDEVGERKQSLNVKQFLNNSSDPTTSMIMRQSFLKEVFLEPNRLVFKHQRETPSTEWTMDFARSGAVVVEKKKMTL